MDIIYSLLSSIGGLIGLIWCLRIISRSIDSEGWKRVDCQIINSFIEEIKGDNLEYRAVIKYMYSVDGLPYEGNTVRFGRSSVLKSTASNICKKYPKGGSARVSVDPENPKQSVLIPGISPSIYLSIIFSVCFFIFGLIIFLDRIAK